MQSCYRLLQRGLSRSHQAVLSAWHCILSFPGSLSRSPIQSYRGVMRAGDWLLSQRTYLPVLRSIFRRLVGILVLVTAMIGFLVIAVDPMQWLAPLLPVRLHTAFGLIYVDQAYVQGLLTTLHTDQIVFGVAIGISSLLVLTAGLLLVQDPMQALKSLGSGIKSSPMAFIRSPITTYRRLIRVRNWLLVKVEYLQSESQKWKTAFTILKLPYSVLRSMGLSPQMAATFLVAGSAVGGGVVVNETILSERSFTRGDSGVYSAQPTANDLVSWADVPTAYYEDDNTLRVDLGATPLGLLEIDSVTVGTAYANSTLPSGETSVVLVGGLPTTSSPAFTETYLEVGHLIVDRWRCTQLTLANIEVFDLIVKQNASDGHSFAPVAGVPRARGIGGGNRADAMITSGGYYDQIKITAASSGQNGFVDVMRLKNIYTKGGTCTLSRIKAGTIEVLLNEVGSGDGLSAKDFTIATSVIYKTFTNEDNVEVLISPPS